MFVTRSVIVAVVAVSVLAFPTQAQSIMPKAIASQLASPMSEAGLPGAIDASDARLVPPAALDLVLAERPSSEFVWFTGLEPAAPMHRDTTGLTDLPLEAVPMPSAAGLALAAAGGLALIGDRRRR
ncbi:MAG: hypothetical protein AAGF47_03160 [Planctomycetota bacterium]